MFTSSNATGAVSNHKLSMNNSRMTTRIEKKKKRNKRDHTHIHTRMHAHTHTHRGMLEIYIQSN